MDEFIKLYGPIGLGLITLFIPYFLQIIKQLTGWQDKAMLITSLAVTYLLADLFMLGSIFKTTVTADWGDVVFFVLGAILYPLIFWFGTQGIYGLFLKRTK